MSATSASAISSTTSVLRIQARTPLDPACPHFFNVSCRWTFEAWSAGTRLKTTPVRGETPSVKASTRQSIPIWYARGIWT